MSIETALPPTVDLAEMKLSFAVNGFAVARGLFSDEEVDTIRDSFDRIAKSGPVPGHFDPLPPELSLGDPLKEFPRVHHPHRFDDVSRRFLVHPGVLFCLRALIGEDVLAAQSMFYYKPPGSRGQAMHQDNFYLMVEPRTCFAAWTAIDDADAENGGLYLIDGTANEEVVCPQLADRKESFTAHFVPPPKGKKAKPCTLKSGDTLFFNGNTIHGSSLNRSTNRFRRSFICHYVPASTKTISSFYLPLLSTEGNEVMIEPNGRGGPCGADADGAVLWEGGAH